MLEQVATATGSGAPAFTSTVGLFIRGEGGFGGEPAPRNAAPEIPDRASDDTVAMQTLAIQTALYRHAGNDTNPIHVDPAFARGAGFEGPILTGQNTLGVAGPRWCTRSATAIPRDSTCSAVGSSRRRTTATSS